MSGARLVVLQRPTEHQLRIGDPMAHGQLLNDGRVQHRVGLHSAHLPLGAQSAVALQRKIDTSR